MLIINYVLCALLLFVGVKGFDCGVDCDGIHDGNYPCNSDCTKFVQCSHITAHETSCPPGLWYNYQIDRCDWPENVPTDSTCLTGDRGKTTLRPITTNTKDQTKPTSSANNSTTKTATTTPATSLPTTAPAKNSTTITTTTTLTPSDTTTSATNTSSTSRATATPETTITSITSSIKPTTITPVITATTPNISTTVEITVVITIKTMVSGNTTTTVITTISNSNPTTNFTSFPTTTSTTSSTTTTTSTTPTTTTTTPTTTTTTTTTTTKTPATTTKTPTTTSKIPTTTTKITTTTTKIPTTTTTTTTTTRKTTTTTTKTTTTTTKTTTTTTKTTTTTTKTTTTTRKPTTTTRKTTTTTRKPTTTTKKTTTTTRKPTTTTTKTPTTTRKTTTTTRKIPTTTTKITTTTTKTTAPPCLQGWSHYPPTGSCFKTISTKLSWYKAKEACSSLAQGSSLAKITTSGENNFAIELMKKVDEKVGFWMGANDLNREGSFVWLDGSEVKFNAWKKGQPDNYGGDEDCVQWWKEYNLNYVWNDCPCDWNYRGQKGMSSVCKMPANPCLQGWSHYPPTGSCFKTVSTKLSWYKAKEACSSLAQGSSLAKITTSGENNFAIELMKKVDEKIGFWMGANDLDREGSFVWLDGSEVKYAAWRKGEPNNGRGKEDCVYWWKLQNWEWNDAPCDYYYKGQRGLPSVCKMPA